MRFNEMEYETSYSIESKMGMRPNICPSYLPFAILHQPPV